MKKEYLAPALLVVEVQMEQSMLQAVSPFTSVSTNADLNYGGGSNQAARVKRDCYNVWDDDWQNP